MSLRSIDLCRMCVLAAMMPLVGARAQSGDVDPVIALKVKAAFLLNFGKFVEWPESVFDGPEAPWVICVLGFDPFGHVLEDTVAGKTVHGRPVRVVRLRHAERDEAARCHILFVSAQSRIDPAEAARVCDRLPVLVVGDDSGFVVRGGMIGFVVEQGRIRFEVCPKALERAGLRAAATFLNLAKLIHSQACEGSG